MIVTKSNLIEGCTQLRLLSKLLQDLVYDYNDTIPLSISLLQILQTYLQIRLFTSIYYKTRSNPSPLAARKYREMLLVIVLERVCEGIEEEVEKGNLMRIHRGEMTQMNLEPIGRNRLIYGTTVTFGGSS